MNGTRDIEHEALAECLYQEGLFTSFLSYLYHGELVFVYNNCLFLTLQHFSVTYL